VAAWRSVAAQGDDQVWTEVVMIPDSSWHRHSTCHRLCPHQMALIVPAKAPPPALLVARQPPWQPAAGNTAARRGWPHYQYYSRILHASYTYMYSICNRSIINSVARASDRAERARTYCTWRAGASCAGRTSPSRWAETGPRADQSTAVVGPACAPASAREIDTRRFPTRFAPTRVS
jgi:hypothetical protein